MKNKPNNNHHNDTFTCIASEQQWNSTSTTALVELKFIEFFCVFFYILLSHTLNRFFVCSLYHPRIQLIHLAQIQQYRFIESQNKNSKFSRKNKAKQGKSSHIKIHRIFNKEKGGIQRKLLNVKIDKKW